MPSTTANKPTGDSPRVRGKKSTVGDDVAAWDGEPLTIDDIVDDCHSLGIVGERELLLAIYMTGTSRLLDHPLSTIVQGGSSTGKSYMVSQVARLFPVADVINATRMTPQALYHRKSVAHKFVVAGERSRNTEDVGDATAALRQLQSEGEITKLITMQEEGGFVTRTVTQKGPIAYVETTTLKPGAIFPEDLNRALLFKTDESEEQTRAIINQTAQRYVKVTKIDGHAIVEKHREYQASLEGKTVTIPFAGNLIERVPARQVEARRVAQQILSMIEAITLFHQTQRRTDKHDRLIATKADYMVAAQILRAPLAESLGVKPAAAALYTKLKAAYKNKSFDTQQATKLTTASERSIRNWLGELLANECIEKVADGVGPKPSTWKLNGKSPDNAVLPKPESLSAKSD